MDKLNNLKLKTANGTRFDFAHISKELVEKLATNVTGPILDNNGDFEKEENQGLIAANLSVVEDKLGMNDLLYRLTQAMNASGGSAILKEKLERTVNFKDLIVNFVLEVTMIMYWVDFKAFKKTTIGLNRAFNFALGLGQEMVKQFEKRIEDEYNLASILETEFSKMKK